MKNNSFIYALAAGSLLLGSCSSSDDDAQNNGAQDNDVQQIVLQVANSGDGLTTRAGRPLDSSEAAQDIQNVKVIVCNGTDVVYATTINDWEKASTLYGNGNDAHGRETTITIPKSNHLAQGTYKVYAIGYSDNSDYGLTSITNVTVGSTFNENTTITLQNANSAAEEIFAGSADYEVKESEKAKGSVVLNRQVAGAFGYVKDIPYIAGATELRLVASNSSSDLVFGSFRNFDHTQPAAAPVYYVVNGTSAGTKKVIYTIDLTEWFNEVKDKNSDGLIDVDNNWKRDASKYAKGSAFAGNFIIPFVKVDGEQTFKLELVDPDDNSVKETWNVNLPEIDGQLSAHTLYTWNGTNAFTTTTATDSKNSYSIVRNHLYGIGKRTSSTPTTPGSDPDEPQSLKKSQDITLRVNDNWEIIHQMELE